MWRVLLCLFLAPLAQTVPAYATAPALLFVACLMAQGLSEIDWGDPTEYAPAVVTAIAMPLTFSIAHGIGLGFITYAVVKVLAGRPGECPPAVYVVAVLLTLKLNRNLVPLPDANICRQHEDQQHQEHSGEAEERGAQDSGSRVLEKCRHSRWHRTRNTEYLNRLT